MTWYVIKLTIKTTEKENIISNHKYFPDWFSEKYLRNLHGYSESRYESWSFYYNPFNKTVTYADRLPPIGKDVYKWKVLISSDDYNKGTFKETLKQFISDYNKEITDENKIRITGFRIHKMISYDKTKFIENVKLN